MAITMKAARTNAGLTQQQAAERLGVNKVTLINWEKGRYYPSILQWAQLCRLYEQPMDGILIPGQSN